MPKIDESFFCMSPKNLRYFVVAAEEENLTRAAARLHIAQSALSRQIAALEDRLGVSLFHRVRRRVSLTETGRMYYEDISRILREMDFADERARHHARGLSSSLRIGIHALILRFPVVSRALHSFKKGFPGTELVLSQRVSAGHIQALKAGAIDAAFIARVAELGEEQLASLPLCSHDHALAVSTSHPFARRRKLCLADLRDEPFLWPQRSVNPPFHDALMRACVVGGLSPRIVQHVLSQDMMPKLVAAGMGVAFVVPAALQPHRGVVYKRVEDLGVTLHLDFLWRRDTKTAPLRQFIGKLRSTR